MENSEVEKNVSADEGSQLNRNRSFKSKQLVRSQAIRESTSPPRTVSPSVRSDDSSSNVHGGREGGGGAARGVGAGSDSSHDGDVFSYGDKCDHATKQRVEIQITSGSWSGQEPEQSWSARRSRRWAAPARDLLSNNPRVACVCGACGACPQCRGRRRRHCPTKQDSGIVCSEDCPDCSDSEHNGSTNDIKKSASGSIEADDQYYCRCAERKEKPKNTLSRTDSDELRSEPLGPELVAFIQETLNKNARDRATLLKIEKELHAFIIDPGRCIVKFPVMTSYGRMLVHRCASLFQLAHHADQHNKTCVVVSKSGTSGGRVPCTSFKSWCVASLPPSPARHPPDLQNAKSILKRDTHSLDEPSLGASAMSRSKSLEQREREYERVRRRIFSSDESQWPWLSAGAPVKLLTPEPGRNKLLKVQSLESPSVPAAGSWRSGGGGAVSKSHSFGGYGDQPQPRALSRQGDLASSSWRLSPSSSGYKTLSLRSTDSVTPSPTGGGTPEPAGAGGAAGGAGGAGGALVWAVTDLTAVPRGVVLIHPQTGRPLTNPDGSVYHFDPANPPLLYGPGVHDAEEDKIDQNNDIRRGRLEKQDSFMDNDSECQSSEDKCCCECEKEEQETQQQQQQNLQQKQQYSEQQEQYSQQQQQYSQQQQQYSQQQQQYSQQQQQYSQQQQQYSHQQHLQQTEASQIVDNNTFEQETSNPQQSPIKTYDATPNQNHTAEPANYSKPSDTATNQKSPNIQQQEATNQQYDGQIITNRSYELANQREVVKMMSQDMVHYNPAYMQPYNTEELPGAGQFNPYLQPDMSQLPTLQAKVAQIHDPNIRPVSLTNMMFPAAMPQGYPTYIPNHRIDQLPQQLYQPILQQMEEPKQMSTSPQQDTTFRIDPSYPFPAVDYACYDPAQLQQHQTVQRSFSVPYNQTEVPGVGVAGAGVGGVQALLPPAFPAQNILLPPPMHQYPVQYPEGAAGAGAGVQWAALPPAAPKLFDVCPVLYPHHYAHYNLLYPQMMQQPYNLCQPVYPLLDKAEPQPSYQRKRNSLPPTTRNTPLSHTPDDKKPDDKEFNRQDSTEITVKIQQIKEQMAALKTRGGSAGGAGAGGAGEARRVGGGGEWRRNSGHGILGNCPAQYQHFQQGRMGDDAQLSSAARAIITSLRNIQVKNTYQQDRRPYEGQQYGRGYERGYDRSEGYRRDGYRRDRDGDKPGDRGQGYMGGSRPEWAGKGDADRRFEPRGRPALGVPCRPPYVFRQMSPGTWWNNRRSPAPVHPTMNHPRRPHPDTRPRR